MTTEVAPTHPAAEPEPPFVQHIREAGRTNPGCAYRLRNLARRHGSTTPRQRRRLFDSVVRHVNDGDLDREQANAFLHALGIDTAAGPSQVSFRVPVAMEVVHEDVDGDIGTFQYHLEEAAAGMYRTRLDGYPRGFRVARPGPADPDTYRRRTTVTSDLRLTVTVPAHTDASDLVAVATGLLYQDLRHLTGYHGDLVDIVDDPTVWDITTPQPDDTGDDGGAWAYHADELNEGNYVDYVPDSDTGDSDEVDPTAPLRSRPPSCGDVGPAE